MPRLSRHEVVDLGLDQFEIVIGLGGKDYQVAIAATFANTDIQFPFADLPIGKAMRAIKQASAPRSRVLPLRT